MMRPSKRARTQPENSISFSAASRPPYNLLSNFHGGAELHFMAARFEHAAIRSLLVETFATCSEAKFRDYFAQLYPSGKASTYVRVGEGGVKMPARGMLGKLAGNAAVGSGRTAVVRMGVLRRLAGVPEGDVVEVNTGKIFREAGLEEGASAEEKEKAIAEFNEGLMRECLRRKFRKGNCADDGTEFRELLLGTGEKRLREAAKGRGSKWSAKGDDDGLLGRMLMELRDDIRKEDESMGGEADGRDAAEA